MSNIASYIHHLKTAGRETVYEAFSFKEFLSIFFTTSFFVIPALGVVILTEYLLGIDPEAHAIAELFTTASPLFIFVFAVLVGPLMEETAFRLLLSQSRWPMIVGYSAFISFMLTTYSETIGYSLFLPLIAVCYIFKEKLSRFHLQYFTYVFWATLLCFGLVHVFNFEITHPLLLLAAPLLALPQLILSTVLSFVRMRYGFWIGYLYHTLHNLTLVGPMLILLYIFPEAFQPDAVMPDENSLTTAQIYTTLFLTFYTTAFIGLAVYNGLRSILAYKRENNLCR